MRLAHPAWRPNFSRADAEAAVAARGNGHAVIRPSSAGPKVLAVTYKKNDRLYNTAVTQGGSAASPSYSFTAVGDTVMVVPSLDRVFAALGLQSI